ncbi:hypothetical protein J6590_025062 [Homalodisca vitripennis]|nr:hypothetical protein J6590_025062 [Homalodisca vitripennis]
MIIALRQGTAGFSSHLKKVISTLCQGSAGFSTHLKKMISTLRKGLQHFAPCPGFSSHLKKMISTLRQGCPRFSRHLNKMISTLRQESAGFSSHLKMISTLRQGSAGFSSHLKMISTLRQWSAGFSSHLKKMISTLRQGSTPRGWWGEGGSRPTSDCLDMNTEARVNIRFRPNRKGGEARVLDGQEMFSLDFIIGIRPDTRISPSFSCSGSTEWNGSDFVELLEGTRPWSENVIGLEWPKVGAGAFPSGRSERFEGAVEGVGSRPNLGASTAKVTEQTADVITFVVIIRRDRTQLRQRRRIDDQNNRPSP